MKILAIKGPTTGIEGFVGAGVGGITAQVESISKLEQSALLANAVSFSPSFQSKISLFGALSEKFYECHFDDM